MSTDHQRFSTTNQAAAIAAYAVANGFEIARTYVDEGLSGLTIKARKGLQKLLADVVAGDHPFGTVLVFDISRWGRFQDPDEAAHYEFLCKTAGIAVEYCAELFPNDGSPSSTILKALRRIMAAEFSRDLSAKVSAGQRRISAMGFWIGGSAGYGLRRQMVDAQGRRGLLLQHGQGKALLDHRSILVPGPAEEVAIVQRIYRLFVDGRLTTTAIARLLNSEGVPSESGAPWSYNTVMRVLKSPKYRGDLLNKYASSKLGEPRVATDETFWVRTPGAFEPIVSARLYDAAQAIRSGLRIFMNREAMLAAALQIHCTHGRLTYDLIDDTPGLPGAASYRARFGTIRALCEAIARPRAGPPPHPYVRLTRTQALEGLAALYASLGYLSEELINQQPDLPRARTYAKRFGGMDRAYAQVGYVQLTHKERASPVGRARLAAAKARAGLL